MMSFDNLPYDILHLICSYAQVTYPWPLRNFSMTSRRNRDAAIPFLFARIDVIMWQEDDESCQNGESVVGSLAKNPAILTAIR